MRSAALVGLIIIIVIVVIAVVAVATTSPDKYANAVFALTNVQWGNPDAPMDVTAAAQAHFNRSGLLSGPLHMTLGDPWPDHKKVAIISYTVNGVPATYTLVETGAVTDVQLPLPPSS